MNYLAPGVRDSLWKNLHEPVQYVLSRPSKGLRSGLVKLACRLAASRSDLSPEEKRRCEIASSVIERIHAGSLIVDDIEDESVVRRSSLTLHLKYGVARALNAGNWLYFEPLTTLSSLQLAPEQELQLHRDCHETLANAHCGQALDIGTRIDEINQEEVAALCASSLEWKTGELVGLAFRMGGYAADAAPATRALLHETGKALGVGLQMLDDVQNFAMARGSPMAAKRQEDLRQRRPSWIWAFAATHLSSAEYSRWVSAVRALPDESRLASFAEEHSLVERAREEASAYLRELASRLQRDFPQCGELHREALAFLQKLENAYE